MKSLTRWKPLVSSGDMRSPAPLQRTIISNQQLQMIWIFSSSFREPHQQTDAGLVTLAPIFSYLKQRGFDQHRKEGIDDAQTDRGNERLSFFCPTCKMIYEVVRHHVRPPAEPIARDAS